jgi:hypothetical protein
MNAADKWFLVGCGRNRPERAAAVSAGIGASLVLAAGLAFVPVRAADTLPAADPAASAGAVETVFRFVPGGWDPAAWTPVRMVNQTSIFPLMQLANGIGTTTNTFTGEDYRQERDNALLVYDTGLSNAEVVVTFSLGPGFRGFSSPGIGISPRIRDGVFESGLAVFVATYAMVVWYEYADESGTRMRVAHVAQLARYTDPARPHVLRFRYSLPERNLAIRLDDSDVLAFSFVGDARLSFIPQPLNSKVALWGCHGAATFHEMRVTPGGTLPFLVRDPAGANPGARADPAPER